MELEQRIAALEAEVKMLKNEVRGTLLDIRESLPEKPAAASQWQKKAWVLALLNLLIAITLFANIYFYLPEYAPFEINPMVASWLRSIWIAIAFLWLILQMYPLALLLEQEDRQWQGIVWRNALAMVQARPGLIAGLTVAVLLIALVNTVFPAAWLLVALVLMVVVASVLVRQVWSAARRMSR